MFDAATHEIVEKQALFAQEGIQMCNEWVKENVLPYLQDILVCNSIHELRESFWRLYDKYREQSTILVDCGFPVETNFLSDVCRQDLEKKEFLMPFPIIDVANFISIDIDRNEVYEKETGLKLRKHNPIDDCIASYYCYTKIYNAEWTKGDLL